METIMKGTFTTWMISRNDSLVMMKNKLLSISPICCYLTSCLLLYFHNDHRSAILAWLFRLDKDTCPLSRRPLSPSLLRQNEELRNEIQLWRQTPSGRDYFRNHENQPCCDNDIQSSEYEDYSDSEFDSDFEDFESYLPRQTPSDTTRMKPEAGIITAPSCGQRLALLRQKVFQKREERITAFLHQPCPNRVSETAWLLHP